MQNERDIQWRHDQPQLVSGKADQKALKSPDGDVNKDCPASLGVELVKYAGFSSRARLDRSLELAECAEQAEVVFQLVHRREKHIAAAADGVRRGEVVERRRPVIEWGR